MLKAAFFRKLANVAKLHNPKHLFGIWLGAIPKSLSFLLHAECCHTWNLKTNFVCSFLFITMHNFWSYKWSGLPVDKDLRHHQGVSGVKLDTCNYRGMISTSSGVFCFLLLINCWQKFQKILLLVWVQLHHNRISEVVSNGVSSLSTRNSDIPKVYQDFNLTPPTAEERTRAAAMLKKSGELTHLANALH